MIKTIAACGIAVLALVACGDDDDDTDYEDQPDVQVPLEAADNRIIAGAVPPGALDSRWNGHGEFGVWSEQLDPVTGRTFRCLYNWDQGYQAGGAAMWCYEPDPPTLAVTVEELD